MREYFGRGPLPRIKRTGFGQKSALLIVDMQRVNARSPLVARAIRNTTILLRQARQKSLPVFSP